MLRVCCALTGKTQLQNAELTKVVRDLDTSGLRKALEEEGSKYAVRRTPCCRVRLLLRGGLCPAASPDAAALESSVPLPRRSSEAQA